MAASYTAPNFLLPATNQGLEVIEIIKRNWKCEGSHTFFELFRLFCRSPHHVIKFQDEDDKFLLYKNLEPATEDTINQVLEYLAKKKVIDPKLFKAGIIYSPLFVNILNKYYTGGKSAVPPNIPQIDEKGNIKLVNPFPFHSIQDKFYYGSVDDLMQLIPESGGKPGGSRGEKAGKGGKPSLTKQKQTEHKGIEKKTTQSNRTAPSELEDKNKLDETDSTPAGAVDSVGDDVQKNLSSKDVPVSVSVSDQETKPSAATKDIVKKTAKHKHYNNLMYPDDENDDPAERNNTGRNWNKILSESPFVKEINKAFQISQKKLTERYNQYGWERLLDCYAYTLCMIDKGKVKLTSAGYFIKALKGDYKITKNDEFCRIKSDILDRNPESNLH